MSSDEDRASHPYVPEGLHPENPQQRDSVELSTWWVGGWLSPALTIVFTLLWVLSIYRAIGNRPVMWNYGSMPYVPGQSVFSTSQPPSGTAPRQVELVKKSAR